jgi:hypothetical protein
VRPANAALGALAADVEKSGRELSTLGEGTRVLIANARSYLTGSVPPPAATGAAAPEPSRPAHRTEDFVPMCDFAFEPAAPDARSTLLSIDGAPFRSLPTRIHLASGRHSLSVKRDHALQERRELLLCGHVAVIPIEAPK